MLVVTVNFATASLMLKPILPINAGAKYGTLVLSNLTG
jgi:hypothetical protein